MPIEAVGIVGAGKRSAYLSNILVSQGFQIRVYDSFRDNLNLLMAKVKWSLEKQGHPELFDNIEPIQDFTKFQGADIIIETESKTVEERFLYFNKILKNVDDNCVIALNNSNIQIKTSLEKISVLPAERCVGLNFSTVYPSSVIELTKTDYTSVDVTDRVSEFLDRLNVKYIVISDVPGGVIERLTRVYINSAFITLQKGKGFPCEIDQAIKKLTEARYGPFEFLDIIGIDYDYNTGLYIWESLGKRNSLVPHEIELRLLQYGQLGRKTNLGLYLYEDGNIVGENPILSNIIKYLGLRKVSDEEIFSDIMIPVLEEAKELAKEVMIGEQDIEISTKLNFGWNRGIIGYSKLYPNLFVKKQKTEFDNLDSF